MATPNPALVEYNHKNREFWSRQRRLLDQRMADKAILQTAIEAIASEAIAACCRLRWFSFGHAARKKVNHEMAPERFSRLPRRRSRAESSLRQIGWESVDRKPRKMATKTPDGQAIKLPQYQYRWGAWIRTREWRNQNPSDSHYLSMAIPKNRGNSTSIEPIG